MTVPKSMAPNTCPAPPWYHSPRRLALFACLLILAPLGNALALELFYGVEFIFGSIAVFLAAARLGLWPAIFIGLAGGLQTVHAWGHPVGLSIYTLEAFFVAGLYARGWRNLVLSDLAFWVAIGVPAALIAYPTVVGMPADATALLAVKQPLNGLFNALVAGLILLGFSQLPFRRGRNWAEDPSQLSGLIFHGLLAIILVAGLIPTLLHSQHQRTILTETVESQLAETAETLADQWGHDGSLDSRALPFDSSGSSRLVGTNAFVLNARGDVLDATTDNPPHPDCRGQRVLTVGEPDTTNPMLRAQQSVFCLSRPMEGDSERQVVVTTDAAPHVQALKRESSRDFFILAGTFLVGLLLAWWLSRAVTISLTRLSRVASETTNGVVVTDPQIRAVWVNRAFSQISGYGRDEVIGRNPGHLLQGPDSSTVAIERMRNGIRNATPFTVEILNYKRSGEPYWVEISSNPIRDHRGRLEGFIAVQTDITPRKHAQKALEETEERLRLLIDQFPGAVLFEDTDRRLIVANQTFTQTFRTGMTPRDLVGMDCQAAASKAATQFANPGAFLARIEELIGAGEVICSEKVEMSDGHAYERDFIPVRSPDRLVGYLWLYRDVTERTRVEEHMREAAIVFDSAAEGIIITNARGDIIDVNHGFERITGYRRAEVIGKRPKILQSGMHDRGFYERMFHTLEVHDEWSGEVWNRRKDGMLFAVRETITAIRDEHGRVDRYLSLFSDITELKEYQDRLEHIAHFDPLTDLPNRELLADRLKRAMSQTERREQLIGVGFIDLDGFKQINDTLGHDAGDELLRTVAHRLSDVLRDGDTLARIGGDEFVAVLVDLPGKTALNHALERLVEAASRPMNIRGRTVSVSASVGATTYPQKAPIDADQLVRQADQAMYSAKMSGKNRYSLAIEADSDDPSAQIDGG